MERQSTLAEEVEKFIKVLRELYAAEDGPYYGEVEQLIESGRQFPPISGLKKLEKHLEDALSWSKSVQDVFSVNSSKMLFSSIIPRVPEDNEIFHTKFSMSEKHVADLYRKAELIEKETIKELRARNAKKQNEPGNNGIYCTCSGPLKGVMHKCELCYGWFHETCVELTANKPFLCSLCCRTKRPVLVSVTPLLENLKLLRVRLQESDALMHLIDRAVRFREVFTQFVQVGEVQDVLEKIARFEARSKKGKEWKALEVSSQFHEEIDDLLLEGLLLELQIDQVEELRKIWLATRDKAELFTNIYSEGENSQEEKPEPEVCSAKVCIKPTDDIIDWIQCDGSCDLWFHMSCVGLKRQEVGKNDMYFCFDCRMKMIGNIDIRKTVHIPH